MFLRGPRGASKRHPGDAPRGREEADERGDRGENRQALDKAVYRLATAPCGYWKIHPLWVREGGGGSLELWIRGLCLGVYPRLWSLARRERGGLCTFGVSGRRGCSPWPFLCVRRLFRLCGGGRRRGDRSLHLARSRRKMRDFHAVDAGRERRRATIAVRKQVEVGQMGIMTELGRELISREQAHATE